MVTATTTRRDDAKERKAHQAALPAHIRLLAGDSPLGFNAGDANLYRYVGNSPVNFLDEDGLQQVSPYHPHRPGEPPTYPVRPGCSPISPYHPSRPAPPAEPAPQPELLPPPSPEAEPEPEPILPPSAVPEPGVTKPPPPSGVEPGASKPSPAGPQAEPKPPPKPGVQPGAPKPIVTVIGRPWNSIVTWSSQGQEGPWGVYGQKDPKPKEKDK